jgi:hypothetical protein
MEKRFTFIIEYNVNENCNEKYEQTMNDITAYLYQYDVEQLQWFTDKVDSTRRIELFTVPSESHYYAIKKMRKAKNHHIFGLLDEIIDGGLNAIRCWALKAV